MFNVRQTLEFQSWHRSLADRGAAKRIANRIVRLQGGLFGDVKPVGEGVSELRIDVGPGYRVYFIQRGKILVVLLCGGNKKTQSQDIKVAKALAADLKE